MLKFTRKHLSVLYCANLIKAVKTLGVSTENECREAWRWAGGGAGSNSVNDRHTYPPFIALVPGKIPPHMNKSDVYPSPKLTVTIKTERAATDLLGSMALYFFLKKALGSNTAH
jgi:hypothetical protein